MTQIQVQTVNVSATAEVDYTPIDQRLTFGVGDTTRTIELRCPQNTVDVAGTPQVRVNATLVDGTAEAGANVSVLVSIIDDDDAANVPTLRWLTPSQEITEGQTVTLRARLENGQGTPVSALQELDVLVTVATPAGNSDWLVRYPLIQGRLRFLPGESEATMTVECQTDDDIDSGETLTVTFGSAPAAEYQLPGVAQRSVVLTSRDIGSEGTQLFAPGAMTTSDGVRVVRQFPIALPTPAGAATLPVYEYEGERVQLVGHRRDKTGNYITGYVYAMDDGAASIPYVAGAKLVDTASGTETLPPESGDFTAVPALTVRCGVQIDATVTEYTATTSQFDVRYNFTSPTGFFPQSGADLCRDDLYVSRMRKVGTSGSYFSAPSGDMMGIVELNVQRFAGERDVMLLELRQLSPWKSGEDPTAPNPFCDGTVNLRWIRLEAPVGWRVEVFDPHPRQARDGVLDNSYYLLTDSGRVETFDPARGNYMWAVLRRVDGTEAAQSAVRAEQYWEQKHICEPVGRLGGQRIGLRNETGDRIVDWHRFGFVEGALSGYQAIAQLGEDRMYGFSTGAESTGYREDWRTGSGNLPDFEARISWSHMVTEPDGRNPGTKQIQGSHDVLGHYSDWYFGRALLHAGMARCGFHFRDLNGDRPPWFFLKATDSGGQWRLHWQGAPDYQFEANSHPHLIAPHIPDSYLPSFANASQYKLAPVDRPWSVVNAGLEDLNLAARRSYQTWPMTHVSRYRRALLNGWIFRRSPLALRAWEEVAAACTTAYPCLQPLASIDSFASYNSNPAEIAARFRADPQWLQRLNRGYWVSYSERGHTNVVARNLGWALSIVAGYYSFATDTRRADLEGTSGIAQARGGVSWFEGVFEWLNLVATPSGVPFAAVKDDDAGDFSSWSEAACGTTNIGTSLNGRSGALPLPTNVGGEGQVMRGLKLMFQIYVARGIFAVLNNYAFGAFSQPHPNVVEATRWAVRQRIGMELRGFSVTKRTTQIVPAALHPAPPTGTGFTHVLPPGAAIDMPVISQADFADLGAWPQIQTYTTSAQTTITGDRAYHVFHKFLGWMGDCAARYWDDPTGYSLGAWVRGLDRQDPEEQIAAIRGEVTRELREGNYDRYRSDLNLEGYHLDSYAHFLNLYS